MLGSTNYKHVLWMIFAEKKFYYIDTLPRRIDHSAAHRTSVRIQEKAYIQKGNDVPWTDADYDTVRGNTMISEVHMERFAWLLNHHSAQQSAGVGVCRPDVFRWLLRMHALNDAMREAKGKAAVGGNRKKRKPPTRKLTSVL